MVLHRGDMLVIDEKSKSHMRRVVTQLKSEQYHTHMEWLIDTISIEDYVSESGTMVKRISSKSTVD
jgi:hypothetical protein